MKSQEQSYLNLIQLIKNLNNKKYNSDLIWRAVINM